MERGRVTVIDMNPDGSFRTPERPPLSARIGRVAVIVAALAVLVALASFALFALAIAVPVALGAGAIAWASMRFRAWRAGGSLTPPPA